MIISNTLPFIPSPCMIKDRVYLTMNLTIGVTDRSPLGTFDPVLEHGSSHLSLKSPNSCEGHIEPAFHKVGF